MKYNYDEIFKQPFTERIYNKSPYLKEIKSTVLYAEDNVAVFDKTIFYAESGGQISDVGTIVTSNNEYLEVIDVQHKLGHKLSIKKQNIDVPFIDVETRILHLFSSNTSLKAGDVVTMLIQWDRRYTIMKNHTLAHFLFYAFNKIFDEKNDPISVKGCVIDEHKSSFSLNKKISDDEWINIKNETLRKISLQKDIIIEPEEKTDTIFYWKYDELIIPCGGTHIMTTKEIGVENIYLHKKNSGKNRCKVYISCEKII